MTNQGATSIRLPLPAPLYSTPYQSGVTDPIWPIGTLDRAQISELRKDIKQRISEGRIGEVEPSELTDAAVSERYAAEYEGRVSRQKSMSIVRADILGETRVELMNVLKLLSEFAVEQMNKQPSQRHVKLLEEIPDSYRVTVTVGFGASLYIDSSGFDRFGLAAQRPKFLKPMPSFPGDADDFQPENSASDLIILISSDHPYINVAVVRYFAEYFNNRFFERFSGSSAPKQMLKFHDVEEGFSRKDKREFLKFDDGIDNIHMGPEDLQRIVYVSETDGEPDWCVNGTYLVYRKIRENMPLWEGPFKHAQEAMIGRDKQTGKPLSRKTEGPLGLTPVFPDPLNELDGPLDSHIRKVQPRRPSKDLFGIDDRERRFLRRPYPFFDGLDTDGTSINGLQFVAFMKSIQRQFEHVVNMWQMNPNFPAPKVGVDALYANNILSNIDGGYYFCPPGLQAENDFFGSGMFGS